MKIYFTPERYHVSKIYNSNMSFQTMGRFQSSIRAGLWRTYKKQNPCCSYDSTSAHIDTNHCDGDLQITFYAWNKEADREIELCTARFDEEGFEFSGLLYGSEKCVHWGLTKDQINEILEWIINK